MTPLHLIISGRVQGVGYRAWLAGQARMSELDGWVRNRTDGTVEAVISGPEAAVESLLAACRRGPLVARVHEVKTEPCTEAITPGFVQMPTV